MTLHASPTSGLSAADVGRLKWRCRRGLLENDLLLQRFFEQYGDRLDAQMVQGLMQLMELSDNDLLDLLLGRTPPESVNLEAPALAVLPRLQPGALARF